MMPLAVDVRSLAVRLLKVHRLRYIDMRTVPDPLTGTQVIVLKFRRDRNHSPKAFFDDLNEHGIQYKKLVKDPEATQIVCELWRKGEKRKVSELREKARDQGRTQQSDGPSGISHGNIPYIGTPQAGAQSIMVQSSKEELTKLAEELSALGHSDLSDLLQKNAGEQNWEELYRVLKSSLIKMKLHERPEIRQLRDAIVSQFLKDFGDNAELLKGARGHELEAKINDVIRENLDLVLDTRGIADSIMRRVASAVSPETKIAQLRRVRRGFASLQQKAASAGEKGAATVASGYLERVTSDIDSVVNGKPTKTNLSSPLVSLVAQRRMGAAYLLLLEEGERDD